MGQSKAEQFKAKMSLIEKKKMSSILHDQVFPSIQGLSVAFNIRKRDEKRVSKSLKRPMVEPGVNQAGLPRTKTA